MIRPYETAVVFDGTLSDDIIEKEQTALEEFFKANSSEYEKTDVWGKRALAYTIRKKNLGHYVIFNYRAEGGVPAAFEKHVKLNEKVLRHLTIVRDLKNEAAREAWALRKAQGEEMPKAEGDEDDEDEEIDRDRRDDRY